MHCKLDAQKDFRTNYRELVLLKKFKDVLTHRNELVEEANRVQNAADALGFEFVDLRKPGKH